jgi:hypothetical protein
MNKQSLLLILTVLCFSCKDKDAVQPGPTVVEHTATPAQTDPDIVTNTLGNTLQFAYLPKDANARKDKLFIFFAGHFCRA